MWILLFVSVTNLALGFGAALYLGHGPDWLPEPQLDAKKPA